MSLPSINYLHLMVSEIYPGQDFQTQGHHSKVKVQTRSDHDIAHLHLLTNFPTKYQLPTPYSFWNRARRRFTNSRSLQQGQRSNQGHTITLHAYNPLTNVPTKYQLPAPYNFWDMAWTRFYRSSSLQQGQRSNQGHTMMLHTYNP